MRYRKYYIALDENEWRIIINSLNELRNKLLGDGRYTDAVDDVLLKVIRSEEHTSELQSQR